MKPAFTSEEWRTANAGNEVHLQASSDDFVVRHVYLSLEADVFLNITSDPYEGSVNIDADNGPFRHALAALALHGQPFGFTQADVALAICLEQRFQGDAERHRRGDENHRVWADHYEERAAEARKLADRIAALLPPEDNQ
jgi:hypothetical protein